MFRHECEFLEKIWICKASVRKSFPDEMLSISSADFFAAFLRAYKSSMNCIIRTPRLKQSRLRWGESVKTHPFRKITVPRVKDQIKTRLVYHVFPSKQSALEKRSRFSFQSRYANPFSTGQFAALRTAILHSHFLKSHDHRKVRYLRNLEVA